MNESRPKIDPTMLDLQDNGRVHQSCNEGRQGWEESEL